ncbi:hypothetical protein ES705_23128 [subsurface metagenome]
MASPTPEDLLGMDEAHVWPCGGWTECVVDPELDAHYIRHHCCPDPRCRGCRTAERALRKMARRSGGTLEVRSPHVRHPRL